MPNVRIKMKVDYRSSPDGTNIVQYKKGVIYEVPFAHGVHLADAKTTIDGAVVDVAELVNDEAAKAIEAKRADDKAKADAKAAAEVKAEADRKAKAGVSEVKAKAAPAENKNNPPAENKAKPGK